MLTTEKKRQIASEASTFSWKQFDLLMKCSAKHDMTDWNEWRKQNPKQPVRLQNVNLEKAYLRGADLHEADFFGANLRGADLSGAKRCDGNRHWADLSGAKRCGDSRRWANLSGADFREADLCGTDFRGANLSSVNFGRAYLFHTNLSWTNLSGANFSGADLWAFLYRANLTSVDLSRANRRVSDFTNMGCQYTKKEKHPWDVVVNSCAAAPENVLDIAMYL